MPTSPGFVGKTAGSLALLLLLLAQVRRGRASLYRSLVHALRGAAAPASLLPEWPPPPRLLVRQGGLAACAASLLLLFWSYCSAGGHDLEHAGLIAWITKERQQRRKKFQDLLAQLPLDQLCRAVPGLQAILASKPLPPVGASRNKDSADSKETQSITLEFPITAESVADATEELVKADPDSADALEGFAVSAALTACELQRSAAAAAVAVNAAEARKDSSDGNTLQSSENNRLEAPMAAAAGEAECDALQQQITQADDLTEKILVRCRPRCSARRIAALYKEAVNNSLRIVRERRRAQWRCVMGLLWRFRGTLPFLAISSLLSMVLGAFSAMRLHYQAAVINLAKEAASGSAAARRASIGDTVGAMIVSEVILQLAEFARARLSLRGKAKVIQELKVALFASLLRQDLDYLEQSDLWQLRSLIGSCGTTISQVVDFPATMVEAACRLGAAVLALSQQNGQLAAFLSLILPLRFILSGVLERLSDRLEQRSSLPDFRGQINSCWSTLVRPAALRTMRTFAREPSEVSTFARFLAVHDQLQEHGQLIYRLMQPLQAMLEHGVEISALWYGGQLALQGKMDFGELSSAVLVAQGAFDGARFAHAAAAGVSRHALGPLTQMAALLARRPRIGLDEPPLSSMPNPKAVRWCFEFQDVSFSYAQRQGAEVLNGLSFRAEEGEFLGILGTTGSGKSTVLSLLLRLYEPSRGRILLDGRDLREYNPLWLRRNIGFVSQELVLCKRTIRDNLLYGCASIAVDDIASGAVDDARLAEPSDEAARAALRAAQCEETFFNQKAFPQLWHTDVGDGGSDLSGGERQRLAMARALLKQPRLLILDEATSALDELSQAHLQDEIERLRREDGLTVVCVAHRLSNLARADRLLVLREGQVAEQGTPAELRERADGIYAEFARAHNACLQGSTD
eukprot:TRINITY_DN107966_c0_g1_i1.p1 TRINITY_DN107966_c0_g1~~TRINITY_DN107966_c0_g1_i1.p1  ORF type:complete len:918 (+),score=213.05 TRINITY_DN107966_c0_g1_i1:33-2786(+)